MDLVELLADYDREQLKTAWTAVSEAGVPAELWWGEYGQEQRLIEDGVIPEGPGIGTILVLPEHEEEGHAALQSSEQTRIQAHLRRLPGDLRRLVIVVLVIVLVTFSLYGVWATHFLGMGVVAGTFLTLVAFEVRSRLARRSALEHVRVERPSRKRRRKPWFDASAKRER